MKICMESLSGNHVSETWCELFWSVGDETAHSMRTATDQTMEKLRKKQGSTVIMHKSYKVPIGGWAKDRKLEQLGLLNWHYIDHSLDGFVVSPMGPDSGWCKEEHSELVSRMRRAIRDARSLSYYTVKVV